MDNQDYSKKNYGNYVRILHEVEDENGNITYVVSTYAHLADPSVKVGDVVNDSTIIGTMGSTGNSTGAHLHLELATTSLTEEEVSGKTKEEIISLVQEKGIDTEYNFGDGNYYNMGQYYKNKTLI